MSVKVCPPVVTVMTSPTRTWRSGLKSVSRVDELERVRPGGKHVAWYLERLAEGEHRPLIHGLSDGDGRRRAQERISFSHPPSTQGLSIRHSS